MRTFKAVQLRGKVTNFTWTGAKAVKSPKKKLLNDEFYSSTELELKSSVHRSCLQAICYPLLILFSFSDLYHYFDL